MKFKLLFSLKLIRLVNMDPECYTSGLKKLLIAIFSSYIQLVQTYIRSDFYNHTCGRSRSSTKRLVLLTVG